MPPRRCALHSNYILPSLKPQNKNSSLWTAYCFAVSPKTNPRNLENPWYGFWGTIAAALAEASSTGQNHLTCISQYRLWYTPTDEPSSSHIVRDGGDAGDTSFSSTIAESHTQWVDPDFSIAHLTLRNMGGARVGELSWPPPALHRIGVPLVMENKRGGKRRKWGVDFPQLFLRRAQYQLQHQAKHVFEMYPLQKSVILVGTAGHWWRFCCVTRETIMGGRTKVKRTRTKKGEMRSSGVGKADGADEIHGIVSVVDEDWLRVLMEGQDDDEERDGSDGEGYDDEQVPYSDDIRADIGTLAGSVKEIGPPLNLWSKAFQFGTKASNQQMWYLKACLSGLITGSEFLGAEY